MVKNQTICFAVGAGNFGGPRTGTKIVECVSKPARQPDVTLLQKTSVDQAALYRLSGKAAQRNLCYLVILYLNVFTIFTIHVHVIKRTAHIVL